MTEIKNSWKKLITIFVLLHLVILHLITKEINHLQRDLAVSIGYDMGKLDSDPTQREKAKNFIQQDYARVDIYYQTLNVKDIKQSAVIGVSVLSSLLSKYSDANLNSFLMNNFSLTELWLLKIGQNWRKNLRNI